ncbi:MAG: urease accessory protein UreE [Alphaproteobacteria bacterium]|nr:urease accessory protein UreE [Alphaproteobacteria bacterium]
MKLSLNTDFTKLARAVSVIRAAERPAGAEPFDHAELVHDERHLRRRVIQLAQGERVLVDLPETIVLAHGDLLVLEDGRQAEIVAAAEELHDIRPRDALHLTELAWHIGNRHLAAAIEPGRILILRDHVIKAMLEGLGATVADTVEPFSPLAGAYSGHGTHGHGAHSHDHGHHDHGERDAHGRLPGDPHYGHSHG